MTRERLLIAPGFEWLPRRFDALLHALGVDSHACSRFARARDVAVYVKASRVDGLWRRLKVSARYALTGAPRLNEFRNLQRLGRAGIPVASPIAAGEERVGGLIARHFLVVRALSGAHDLETALRRGLLRGAALEAVLERAARAIAQMHALGFGHRDLFLRNILVTPSGDVAFIDCRKGEWHALQVRGVAYDLACFDKWAATLLPREARAGFFRAYLRHACVRDTADLLRRTDGWRRWLVTRYLTTKRAEHRRDVPLLDAPPLVELEPAAACCKVVTSRESGLMRAASPGSHGSPAPRARILGACPPRPSSASGTAARS